MAQSTECATEESVLVRMTYSIENIYEDFHIPDVILMLILRNESRFTEEGKIILVTAYWYVFCEDLLRDNNELLIFAF